MKILLATDGSEYASAAARQCGKIVSELETVKVKIITVIDNFTPMATEPFITSQEFLANIETQMRENAEKIISDAEKIMRTDNKNLDLEKEILMGSPKRIIVREAKDWEADLVVVGSHGYGFWSRTLLGSVSDAIVHHSPCSVLIVKKAE